MDADIAEAVSAAVAFAESSPFPVPDAALDTRAVEYPAGNFLDGEFGRVDLRNTVFLEYFVGFA